MRSSLSQDIHEVAQSAQARCDECFRQLDFCKEEVKIALEDEIKQQVADIAAKVRTMANMQKSKFEEIENALGRHNIQIEP